MAQVWLVTVPNNKGNPNSTFSAIQSAVGNIRTFRIEIPNLVVGTLDTLMQLSDDLSKIGMQVENIVRKIERQYVEIADVEAEPLRVNETAVEAYLRKFQWDFAQYQHQGRQLTEIVCQIQSVSAKIEEDLKVLSTAYTEKNLALATVKRKKVVNLATSELEDFLTPVDIAKIDVLDSEHLLTVLVVVPRNLEKEFLNNYATLGSNIAAYGGPEWGPNGAIGQNDGRFGPSLSRNSVTGSPVVPGSEKKVTEEGDSVMYAITLLKGQFETGTVVDDVFIPGKFIDYVEPLKTAFRDKRFIIRDIKYDPSKAGGIDAAILHADTETKQVKHTTLRWCKAHFGAAYNGYVHIKVIQAFAESVLRYGLPVDFVSFFLEPNPRNDKESRNALTKAVLNLCPELMIKKLQLDDEDDDDPDSLPYMLLRFPVIGATSN